jgi:hypothetical protein
MGIPESAREQLGAKFGMLFPHLDERQRRLLLGAEARILGHGGIRAVAVAAGVSDTTVRKGVGELVAGEEPLGRVRRPGGGRKRAARLDPELRPALLALVEPDLRGTRCRRCGGRRSPPASSPGNSPGRATVSRRTRSVTCSARKALSLQAGAKTLEGTQHPDRDAQFRYSNEQARAHRDTGQPVISVDTKKKELVGQYKNSGREWTPSGEPVAVNTHDFLDRQAGKAIPYGIYDTATDSGWGRRRHRS